MAIIRKKVVKFGQSTHIVLPKGRLGQDVIVLFDDELENFKDMITQAHLFTKIQDKKINEVKGDLDDLKARIAFVERFLTSMSDFGKRNNEARTEQQSAPSEANEQELHSTETQGDSAQSSQ